MEIPEGNVEMLTRHSTIPVGQSRQEKHPLFNHLIVGHIFEYLDFYTLKSARLTCSFWKEKTDPIIQDKSKVTIAWKYGSSMPNIPVLSTFIKYMEAVSVDNVLFRNYFLQYDTDPNLLPRKTDEERFWRECGQHIRELCLNSFEFSDESEVRNVLYKWTPNMKSVRLEYNSFRTGHRMKDRNIGNGDTGKIGAEIQRSVNTFDDWRNVPQNWNLQSFSLYPLLTSEDFPIPWRELFTAYPDMKTLRVDSIVGYEEDDNIKNLLVDMIEFQKENPTGLNNLKDMHIFAAMNDQNTIYRFVPESMEHFALALQLQLKLESFFIDFEGPQDDGYIFLVRKYIKKISPSLKSMKLTSVLYEIPVFPTSAIGETVVFPKLTNLTLGIRSLNTSNLDFLQYSTPNLRILKIEQVLSWYSHIISPLQLVLNTRNMRPLKTLVSLDLFDRNTNIITVEGVRIIDEWFPNLTKFSAVLNDKSLLAVYKHFQNRLTELNVYGYQITDAGITGKFNAENNDECKPSSAKKQRLEDENCLEGLAIWKLRKLKKFTVGWSVTYSGTDTNLVKLTNDAVYNGFIKLKELTYLYVPTTMITKAGFQDLCEHVNLVTIDTPRYCRGVIFDRRRGRMEI